MGISGQLSQMLLLLLTFGTPFLAPIVFCFVWRMRGARLRKQILWLSGGAFVAWCSLFIIHVINVGPGRSGVVTQGFSPLGREYCIVQTYTGLVEPYRVSFYIRDARGVWQWNALAHDDNAWRSPNVSFSEASIVVTREHNYRREIQLMDGSIRQHSDVAAYNQPANLTAAELSALHDRAYK
jgi:hypothetical protein